VLSLFISLVGYVMLLLLYYKKISAMPLHNEQLLFLNRQRLRRQNLRQNDHRPHRLY
jgi:hypothetical protein